MGQFEKMSISRDLYNLARREMNDLALSSGGRSFVAADLSDARAAFARVAADIGTLYSLGYYPTEQSSRRKVSRDSITSARLEREGPEYVVEPDTTHRNSNVRYALERFAEVRTRGKRD